MTFTVEQLDSSTETSKKQLARLATAVFSKEEGELEKTEILTLLNMELASIPSKLSVNVDEVRRTQLSYCTWKGGLWMEIDLTDLKQVARDIVTNHENPVEGFIVASSYIKAFLQSKLDRTENLLREQINKTIRKDGLEILPGTRFDGVL